MCHRPRTNSQHIDQIARCRRDRWRAYTNFGGIMEADGGGLHHAPSGDLTSILSELEQASWNLEDATLRDGLAGQAGAFGFFGGVAQALGSVADAIMHGRQWLAAEFAEDRLEHAAVASA